MLQSRAVTPCRFRYLATMQDFWSHCLKHFQGTHNIQQVNTWLKPLKVHIVDGTVHLVAPNRFVAQWVKDKFLGDVEGLANAFFNESHEVELSVESPKQLEQEEDNPATPKEKLPAQQVTALPKKAASEKAESRLNPLFNFSSFVRGKANDLARAAALQVAENPGSGYNPLFVYGGVGLGKTHLIQAIGNAVLEENPMANVRYIHAERYVTDMVKAFRHKSFDDFKRKYDSLDILLIDDIQFFSGKERTQEEFFYTFNNLIESHKQVIITSDTFPRDMEGIEERLKSRFSWGLTVMLDPPELEMRVAILLDKALKDGEILDENTAFFIAKQIRSNVRELEGALKRVIAFSRFHKQGINLEVAKEALKDLLAVQHRQISVENIQKLVADFYRIKVSDMFSKKRTRNLVRPRQIAMHLAKELTDLSLPDIGQSFGGRDHTTVLHAYRKVEELKNSDNVIRRDYAMLLQVLTG